MKRVNKFRIRLTKEQEKVQFSLCEMSAVLWNKLNYIRRQAFFEGRFDWKEGVDELYNEFKPILGSATANCKEEQRSLEEFLCFAKVAETR